MVKLFHRPRLAVIYVEYNKEKYPGAFERLRSYLSKPEQRDTVYVLVDNKDEGTGSRYVDDHTFYVQGNNIDREFSGWQKGVEFLRHQNIPFDLVLFANEAFEAVEPSYLRNHNVNWLILKSHTLKAVFGIINTLWEKTRIDGRSARLWINTNCFFVPKAIVDKLGTLVCIDDRSADRYLPEKFPGPGEIFDRTAPMNSIYKEHIVNWLTERWHSKIALDEESWPLFRAKAKAIFNEALLSIRIRELGYIILPYSLPEFAFRKTRGFFRKLKKIISAGQRRRLGESIIKGTEHGGETP